MVRLSRFLLTVFCLCSLLLAFQGTAHAYADPGSGLLALQIIGSTLAGIGFYFRQKIGKFFMRGRNPAKAAYAEADSQDNSSGAATE
jgi:uncharacterized RDD family membrane protein YckC